MRSAAAQRRWWAWMMKGSTERPKSASSIMKALLMHVQGSLSGKPRREHRGPQLGHDRQSRVRPGIAAFSIVAILRDAHLAPGPAPLILIVSLDDRNMVSK
jgi:hypothetical protein